MKFNPFKFALVLVLIAGLLSACASQPADTDSDSDSDDAPASTPTEAVVPVISSPTGVEATAAPTNTASLPPTDAQTATVSFANDVLPILESRCVNCHGGEETKEGLILKSYASLMAGSDNGPVVAPSDADNSLLAELVSTQKMPKRGPKLTPPQIQLILDWINQGALDN